MSNVLSNGISFSIDIIVHGPAIDGTHYLLVGAVYSVPLFSLAIAIAWVLTKKIVVGAVGPALPFWFGGTHGLDWGCLLGTWVGDLLRSPH
jgi:hypothetical protein